jgi:hypothetical protein
MSSHIFNLHFELLLRALGSSLEGHVFEEVRGSIVGSRFIARSSINPDPDRSRLASRNSFTSNPKTVAKGRDIGSGSPQNVIGKARKGPSHNGRRPGGAGGGKGLLQVKVGKWRRRGLEPGEMRFLQQYCLTTTTFCCRRAAIKLERIVLTSSSLITRSLSPSSDHTAPDLCANPARPLSSFLPWKWQHEPQTC